MRLGNLREDKADDIVDDQVGVLEQLGVLPVYLHVVLNFIFVK